MNEVPTIRNYLGTQLGWCDCFHSLHPPFNKDCETWELTSPLRSVAKMPFTLVAVAIILLLVSL